MHATAEQFPNEHDARANRHNNDYDMYKCNDRVT